MLTIAEKIVELSDLIKIRDLYRQQHKKVVFTNGCFDIIHAGHALYLQEAKTYGDVLILGLNSDNSIKRLKGDSRPINNQDDRAIVLASMAAIDYIVIFNEDTPYDLIKSLNPDVLVKGGDWTTDQIVGSDIVLNNNGKVFSLSFLEGKSTTSIIKKVKANHE
jgi:D-beta-D-heptose 7-phosphate kinase/D-beta-D-heptose 1-phosphate adenosyltransferase